MRPFATTLALTALAVMALAPPAPAAAQGVQRYCDGALTANHVYSHLLSNGRTGRVVFHGQIENTDPHRRRILVTMDRLARITINGVTYAVEDQLSLTEFRARQKKDLLLLTIAVNSPTGEGAPGAVQAVQALRIRCTFL